MATLAIHQQTTKSIPATSQAKAANASTAKPRLGFLAILLRSMAFCAV